MWTHRALLAVALTAAMTGHAHAYIDPGTGSVVTAAVLGFFAAIAYTVRKYFYRIKDAFSRKPAVGRGPKGDA
jgi:O-antigen/teichoic acid export membrane protein